jgi:hypothetical protein
MAPELLTASNRLRRPSSLAQRFPAGRKGRVRPGSARSRSRPSGRGSQPRKRGGGRPPRRVAGIRPPLSANQLRGLSASARGGLADAFRTLHPRGPLWTFWGYLGHRRANDKGMRLDRLSLSPDLAAGLVAAGVSREGRGRDGASDHAPAWIELDGRGRPRRRSPKAPTPGPTQPRPAAARRDRRPRRA